MPARQQPEAYCGGHDVAEGARRLGDAHHQRAVAVGHELGDVVGVEAVFTADAQADYEETDREHGHVGHERGDSRRREYQQRAETEEEQVAVTVAELAEQNRTEAYPHKVGRPYHTLHHAREPWTEQDVEHRNDDAGDGGHRRADQLAERRHAHYHEVGGTQGHRGEIHHMPSGGGAAGYCVG